MAFELTASHLRRLQEINAFAAPSQGLMFFGIRGCLPLVLDDHAFAERSGLRVEEIDYRHPRCVLGQWKVASDEIAVFPGSTVPHEKHTRRAAAADGAGANQIMTGYYDDYRKGMHRNGTPTGHEAFRQTKAQPIRRTSDDLDYDRDDRVEVENPYDNIHAAWCQGVNQADYASAGCQVVVGYPACGRRGAEPAVGPWKTFHANAYGRAQRSFPYLLLHAREVEQVARDPEARVPARVRFGSEGPLVEKVQRALQKRGFYEGRIDGDFGPRTARALVSFQKGSFGVEGDDGIAGPVTGEALGIRWPQV